MRNISVVSLLICFLFSMLFSQVVIPKQDGTPVYSEQDRTKEPIYTFNKTDNLQVLEKGKGWLKITINGKIGWVQSSNVSTPKISKTFIYEDAEVMGYLDNPTPVYILDGQQGDDAIIELDRSFKDNLRENEDEETFKRRIGK